MIYPISLYNFGKVCKDSSLVGDVLRALCKQKIDLSPEAQIIYDMITNDNEWMDERIADRKERDRKRKEEARKNARAAAQTFDLSAMSDGHDGQNGCPKCPTDTMDKTDVRNVRRTKRIPKCPTDKTDSEKSHGKNGFRKVRSLPTYLPSSLPTYLPSTSTNVDVVVGGGEGNVIDERLIYPEADMQKYYARQMGVPEDFIKYFNNRIKEIGFQYINRNGATVNINRNNWKSVLRKFYEHEQRKEHDKTKPVKNALHQDGYKAEMEMA